MVCRGKVDKITLHNTEMYYGGFHFISCLLSIISISTIGSLTYGLFNNKK